MGVWDAITEIFEAAAPWGEAQAEAPAEEPQTQEEAPEAPSDEGEAVKEVAEADEEAATPEPEEEEEEEEEEDEDEDEDEEDEPVCPKETLEEECKNTPACAPYKSTFDECVERVTTTIDEKGEADEDCVEEFFHLAHCASECAAPALWAKLK